MSSSEATANSDKKLVLTEDLQGITAPPGHQEHFPTKDTWERIEKTIYRAPEETPDTDHTEFPGVVPEESTLPSSDEISELPVSQDETLDVLQLNATSAAEAEEPSSSSEELPVLQEDHTPDVHWERISETERIYSSTTEEIPAVTSSPHAEETDVPRPATEESGDKSSDPEEGIQIPGTQSWAGLDTYSSSGLVPTTGSGRRPAPECYSLDHLCSSQNI